MMPYYEEPTITLYHGECLEVMASLPDASVDAVITDPPYELSFMGKAWDGKGVAYSIPLWREVMRVLKPGGHLLAFGGTRTYHRMTCAIEDAGFEIRDCIQWIYGSGFPKSHDVSKAIDRMAGAEREVIGERQHLCDAYPNQLHPTSLCSGRTKARQQQVPDGIASMHTITAPATPEAAQWEGWGTALKPANEPIVLARKPLSEPTVAANVLRWGTGAINVDVSRIEVESTDPNKRRDTGGYASGVSVAIVPNAPYNSTRSATLTQGRWPANVILDEAAGALLDEMSKDTRAGKPSNTGTAFLNDGLFMQGQDRPLVSYTETTVSGASRFFYCAKASRAERNKGCEGLPEHKTLIGAEGHAINPMTGRAVVDIPRANHHPTVKPQALMRYLIRLITPAKGIVFDPFMGSGSTGVAALDCGCAFIGIEQAAEYIAIADARIAAAACMPLDVLV